jgi:hypothetical protein
MSLQLEPAVALETGKESGPMRIDSIRLADSIGFLPFSVVIVLATTLTAMFGWEQFHSRTTDFPVQAGPSWRLLTETDVLKKSNSFLAFSVVLEREGYLNSVTFDSSCESSISIVGEGNRRTVLSQKQQLIRFRFGEDHSLSEPVMIFSSRELNETSYTLGFRIFTNGLLDLKSISVVEQVGEVSVTRLICFLTVGFVLGGLLTVVFLVEAQFWSENRPKWSSELKLSVLLLVVFELSLYGKNVHEHTLRHFFYEFFVKLTSSISLRVIVLNCVISVRRTDSKAIPNMLFFTMAMVAMVIGDLCVAGLEAASVLSFDELSSEQSAMRSGTWIEVFFFMLVIVHMKAAQRFIDESEQQRFLIYACLIGFLSAPAVIGRFMQGFCISTGYLLIPEIAIMTSRFVFAYLMIYFHWPRSARSLDDYGEIEDAGGTSQGESLVE